MASPSALEALVACARAIQDRDLKLADSLLYRILNLAAKEPDKQKSEVVKYFAEALARRAYGLHPASTNLTLHLSSPFPRNWSLYWFDHIIVEYAIKDALMGKKRLHFIGFFLQHFDHCLSLFQGLSDPSDNPLSVRVSVILPPFLENIVHHQQQKQRSFEMAQRGKVELEVVYANSLGEVGKSMLEFRRTEDEAVAVFYFCKLQTLTEARMEREFLKLRQVNPDIIIIVEQDVDLNDSNFIKRLEESFSYYSQRLGSDNYDNYYRRQIGGIIGCEGRNRIVRLQTLAQWQSRLGKAGFLQIPLNLDRLPTIFERDKIEEDNGSLVISWRNRPLFFVSAWKLGDREHHLNPINDDFFQALDFNPVPSSEDTVPPLQIFPEGFSLNRLAVSVEINDMLEDICLKYELPCALTWACEDYAKQTPNKIMSDPYTTHILSIKNSFCHDTYWVYRQFIEQCSSKHYFLAERPIVEKLLQSNKPFRFEQINGTLRENLSAYPLFGPHAIVATRLQDRYDDVYVVEFFLPLFNIELKKAKSWALDIFIELKDMKKMFVSVQGTEVGFQVEAISNIPQGVSRDGHDVLEIRGPNKQGEVIPNFHPPPPVHASSSAGISLFTTPNPTGYNGVLEIPASDEKGGVIPNFHPPLPMHASSSTRTGLFTTPNPRNYNGVLVTPESREQGRGSHTSFEPSMSNENETVKEDTNNLRISSAKKRKLTSDVWQEFVKKEDADGKECAICAHCDRKFDGSSKKGTTHLRKHLERCKKRATKVRDQQRIFSVGIDDSKFGSFGEGNSSFDQERSSMDVARMIIKHQYPLNIVEHEFFRILLKNLQPMFKLQSQEALSSYIIRVYNEEKHKLLRHFDKLSCRFSLTISVWENDNGKTFCYVVQFVDDNWKLKKKILALRNFGLEVDTKVFHEELKRVLTHWNVDKKVCSIIMNSSPSNFKIAEEIRKNWLSFGTSHSLSSFFIICDECIHGFLSKGNAGENDFNMLQNAGKSVDGVIGTSNPCLVAIHEVYKRLSKHERRDYPLMNVKSDDNNWRTSSLVLAIAVILDPRFKFKLVEFSYNTLYGNQAARSHLTEIRNGLTEIFNDYARNMNNGALAFNDTNSLTLLNDEESTIESFHRWYNSQRNVNIEASWKSELDNYLQEPLVSCPMEFDLLTWWSEQASSFPILGRMARDILAIPMSSIISVSTFSEKAMMDNPIFSGLHPEIIEAMICSKDWLESPKDCCPIVKSKNTSSLAHHLESERFFSESDNEAQWKEDLGSEATTWTEEEIRAYLVFPFTEKELKCLNEWISHAIIGEYVGQDKIPGNALAPLLIVPPYEVDLRNPRDYYIDDTVVNQFFVLLKRRYERFPHKYLKHHSFDSSTATFLIDGSKAESQVLNWVKQEDLKSVSKLFLPMCLHEHWLLFVADIDGKKLLWLDSNEHSHMSNSSEKQVILQWFLEFLLPSMGYDRKDWSFDIPKDIPLQKNSVDCALFVMKYADCLTHGNYFPFTQKDMHHFRHRTFLDLYRGSLCLGNIQSY